MNVAHHWRLSGTRYRLAGQQCPSCQVLLFPLRAVCPQCGAHSSLVTTDVVPAEQAAQTAWPRLGHPAPTRIIVQTARCAVSP